MKISKEQKRARIFLAVFFAMIGSSLLILEVIPPLKIKPVGGFNTLAEYGQWIMHTELRAKEAKRVNAEMDDQMAKQRFEEYQKNKEEFLEYKQDQQLFQEYEKKREDFENYKAWKGSKNSSYMSQPKFADLLPSLEPDTGTEDSIDWIMKTYCHTAMCGTQMDPCRTLDMYLICDDA